jgi:hypothetical protein
MYNQCLWASTFTLRQQQAVQFLITPTIQAQYWVKLRLFVQYLHKFVDFFDCRLALTFLRAFNPLDRENQQPFKLSVSAIINDPCRRST